MSFICEALTPPASKTLLAKQGWSSRFACNKFDTPLLHEYASRKRLRRRLRNRRNFQNAALVRRARILAFALWSGRWDSHTSKSDDRSNVFKLPHCIRVDTFPQARILKIRPH